MRQTERERVPNGAGPDTGPALTLAEAARLVGVSERALRKRAERGTLTVLSDVRGGRVVAVVDRAELARLYPTDQAQPEAPDPPQAAPATDQAASAERVAELRERIARLEGQLAMSERVEQSAQRAADKLEAKLEDARREALTLARALGQAEAERDRYRAQLQAPRGILRRLLGR